MCCLTCIYSKRLLLRVLLLLHLSGEETKYGCDPAEVVALAQHVAQHCPALRLAGLMTIGQPDYSSRPENFTCLAECRQALLEGEVLRL
jgi:uncharacterized pyridoxal phosphate-containing UPF0001 family protein